MGVVNTKSNICGDHGPYHRFEAKPNRYFTVFDNLVMLTTRSDTYISRSGNFHVDNDDNNDRHTFNVDQEIFVVK